MGLRGSGLYKSSLQTQSVRRLTDRSFRLANLLDLKVGQDYKGQIAAADYHPFQHTSKPERDPDLSRQMVIDIRSDEGVYQNGHIKGAVWLPRDRFDAYEFIDTKGGITFDEVYNTFRDVGVTNDTSEIILYDNQGEVRYINTFIGVMLLSYISLYHTNIYIYIYCL